MARTYSTQLCTIWDEAAFRELTPFARDAFWMLNSQPEMSAAGSMAMTLRRWKALIGDPISGLDELVTAGYVLIDEDTEEVLLVPFAESDGGYKHSKRVHAVRAAVKAIRSASLRSAAVKELQRLGVAVNEPPDTEPDATREPVDSATDVVTLVGTAEHPSSHKPQERAASNPEDIEPSPFCSKHPKGTDTACGPCGRAKLLAAAWSKAQPRRQAAALELRRACPLCNGDGWLTDDAGKPIGHCDHRRLSTAS